ncbi:hypothetical protein Pelo_17988 [Pelomyxa schiedti]|nr:hypothetical protein Pelo_17988 [Pelomyxa schiedti]
MSASQTNQPTTSNAEGAPAPDDAAAGHPSNTPAGDVREPTAPQGHAAAEAPAPPAEPPEEAPTRAETDGNAHANRGGTEEPAVVDAAATETREGGPEQQPREGTKAAADDRDQNTAAAPEGPAELMESHDPTASTTTTSGEGNEQPTETGSHHESDHLILNQQEQQQQQNQQPLPEAESMAGGGASASASSPLAQEQGGIPGGGVSGEQGDVEKVGSQAKFSVTFSETLGAVDYVITSGALSQGMGATEEENQQPNSNSVLQSVRVRDIVAAVQTRLIKAKEQEEKQPIQKGRGRPKSGVQSMLPRISYISTSPPSLLQPSTAAASSLSANKILNTNLSELPPDMKFVVITEEEFNTMQLDKSEVVSIPTSAWTFPTTEGMDHSQGTPELIQDVVDALCVSESQFSPSVDPQTGLTRYLVNNRPDTNENQTRFSWKKLQEIEEEHRRQQQQRQLQSHQAPPQKHQQHQRQRAPASVPRSRRSASESSENSESYSSGSDQDERVTSPRNSTSRGGAGRKRRPSAPAAARGRSEPGKKRRPAGDAVQNLSESEEEMLNQLDTVENMSCHRCKMRKQRCYTCPILPIHRFCLSCIMRHHRSEDFREGCPICKRTCTCALCRKSTTGRQGVADDVVAAAAGRCDVLNDWEEEWENHEHFAQEYALAKRETTTGQPPDLWQTEAAMKADLNNEETEEWAPSFQFRARHFRRPAIATTTATKPLWIDDVQQFVRPRKRAVRAKQAKNVKAPTSPFTGVNNITRHVHNEIGGVDQHLTIKKALLSVKKAEERFKQQSQQQILTVTSLPADNSLLELAFYLLLLCDQKNSSGSFCLDITTSNIYRIKRPNIIGNTWAVCYQPHEIQYIHHQLPIHSLNFPPEFFLPEQYRTGKADVWAVGRVLLEAQRGHHIYTESHHRSQDPPQVLIQWLLERDYFVRPTSKQAMYLCGALMFLPQQFTSMLCSQGSMEQPIELFSSDTRTTSLLVSVHTSAIVTLRVLSGAQRGLANILKKAVHHKNSGCPPVPSEILCTLMFTAEALSDIPGFQQAMLEFCWTKEFLYNSRTLL